MDASSTDLLSLLNRLKGAQHALIEDAARQVGLPSTAILRKIAELENVIAAVLALIEERQGRPSADP
jgi:predicted ArsR family transcriptional regulator